MCSYSEAHEAEGPVDAMLGAIGHSIVHLFTTVPFLRAIVIPILPKPGDGPPEAYREKNRWKFTLYGFTAEESPAKGRVCQVCAFLGRANCQIVFSRKEDVFGPY
jgi:hypothetical protein